MQELASQCAAFHDGARGNVLHYKMWHAKCISDKVTTGFLTSAPCGDKYVELLIDWLLSEK